MIITAFSGDFDGCFSNYSYLGEAKSIVEANETLLSLMQGIAGRKIFMVGSNRQSLSRDFQNAVKPVSLYRTEKNKEIRRTQAGSCFQALIDVSKAIEADFHPFLLSDLYNTKKSGEPLDAGTSLTQIMEQLEANRFAYKEGTNKGIFLNYIFDESKLTLLYAQMHLLATENPGHQIEFHFYDDAGKIANPFNDEERASSSTFDREDILGNLHRYFTKYPELIPTNVTLHLHQYRGEVNEFGKKANPLVADYTPIKGQYKTENGDVADHNFRHTVKEMAAVTIEKSEDLGGDLDARPVLNYLHAIRSKFYMSDINCIQHYVPGDKPNVAVPSSNEVAAPKPPVNNNDDDAPSVLERRPSRIKSFLGLTKTPSKGHASTSSSFASTNSAIPSASSSSTTAPKMVTINPASKNTISRDTSSLPDLLDAPARKTSILKRLSLRRPSSKVTEKITSDQEQHGESFNRSASYEPLSAPASSSAVSSTAVETQHRSDSPKPLKQKRSGSPSEKFFASYAKRQDVPKADPSPKLSEVMHINDDDSLTSAPSN